MQDKPRNQQRLARDLADLLDVLTTTENLLGFIDGFWKTMAREWGNIDALRMDKYLYLVRCYVNKGFEKVAQNGWENEELRAEYLKVLEVAPLNARDPKVPNGLRYHVVDIYVDELDKVDTERNAPLEALLKPLRNLGTDSITKPVRKRVQEALEDERLADWKGESVKKDEIDLDDGAVTNDPHAGVSDDEDGEFGGFGD